jgi:hypothetical protein
MQGEVPWEACPNNKGLQAIAVAMEGSIAAAF